MKRISLDWGLIVPSVGLLGLSLAILSSTTPALFLQQTFFTLFGILLFILFSSFDIRILKSFTPLFYLVAFVSLLGIFLMPEIRGSHRWIDIGSVSIQPSELIKPFFIIMFASFFGKTTKPKLSLILTTALLFLPIVFLIFRQPDLGNVLVYVFTFLTLMFVGNVSLVYFFVLFVFMVSLLPLFWFLLKPYQQARIFSFLNPLIDPSGTSYNAFQAIIAIGSGGLFGLGLGRGTQSHLLFLPEYHTDFVFASLNEELGFLGGGCVILLYFFLLARILQVSFKSPDQYTKLICIGVFSQIFIQVFINIGMNLGLLPITGITLPLVSYGGSSILSTCIDLGIIASIARFTQTPKPLVIG